MSKKILKRSLALGALMAFVITGNAWAAGEKFFPRTESLKLYEVSFDNATYDEISITSEDSFGVSMAGKHTLKANQRIVISSYGSGIAAENIPEAEGSELTISAPTITIKDIKEDKRSGIHLDDRKDQTEGAKVYIKNFNQFSINATGFGSYGIRAHSNESLVDVSGNPNSTITINAGSSGVVTTSTGDIKLSARNIYIKSEGGYNDGAYKGQAIASNTAGGTINISATNEIKIENTNLAKDPNSNYIGHAIWASNGSINIGTAKDANGNELKKKADIIIRGDIKADTNGAIDLKLETYESSLNGSIKDNNITVDGKGTNLLLSNGATWNVSGESNVSNLISNKGKIVFEDNSHVHIDAGSGDLDITKKDLTAKSINGLSKEDVVAKFDSVAKQLGVKDKAKGIKATVVLAEGDVTGEVTGEVIYSETAEHEYYHGTVTEVTEKVNTKNQAISDAAIGMKLHWRAHVDDMNKRMGELRDANGEHGVWTRMVRGESEYKNTKAQYNQYQLGYDEKLSVDKRWTVGAAVTFSDGKASYGYGSTEDKSTAFAIYGTKLNNDGTFVDLIARYAHLESDVDDQAGTGSYSANGMSVSAEVGKRIQQDNGLWIEPQVQLTYGTVDSAEYKIGTKTVEVGDMDSLIGRIGFRIGKDIEKGNVYARASYLYDFEGETENAFRNDTARRSFNEDLGGGWWEVGVGANINLSKATYVYADVEKTFGGEVDTNWQWNLGIRYSF